MVQQKIINGANFCVKDWYEKGVRQVADLLDEHGDIYMNLRHLKLALD